MLQNDAVQDLSKSKKYVAWCFLNGRHSSWTRALRQDPASGNLHTGLDFGLVTWMAEARRQDGDIRPKLFFQPVNACYERCTMIMTSSCGFSEWGEIFGDPVVAIALLDRWLHHAIVVLIEGNSYRLREYAALIPEHLRSRPALNEMGNSTAAKRRPGENQRNPKEVTRLNGKSARLATELLHIRMYCRIRRRINGA